MVYFGESVGSNGSGLIGIGDEEISRARLNKSAWTGAGEAGGELDSAYASNELFDTVRMRA
jgi:hypothetical protein